MYGPKKTMKISLLVCLTLQRIVSILDEAAALSDILGSNPIDTDALMNAAKGVKDSLNVGMVIYCWCFFNGGGGK